MSIWDGLNRRKFPRAKYPCMVTMWLGSEDEEVFLTHTENVGIGGVCLILNQRAEKTAEVGLEIDLLDFKENIKCRGKVMWAFERKGKDNSGPLTYDTGIEFVDIYEADRSRIEAIVKQLVKHPQNRA